MPTSKKKNPAAVALGRLGGQKKVPKGLAAVSPERREEIRKLGQEALAAKRKAGKNKAKLSISILALLIWPRLWAQEPSPSVAEPETIGIFYALGSTGLIPLERQSAAIHTSMKFVGVGATAKSGYEFKPGHSPVRIGTGSEFVVRSPFANTGVDPNAMYALRVIASKGKKRELVISRSHAFVGTMSAKTNLSEGELPIEMIPYGAHSLRIKPSSKLPPGEYALGTRHGANNVFCFGVDR